MNEMRKSNQWGDRLPYNED